MYTNKLHEYMVHAPITYEDARQFLQSLSKPFTGEDTMKMLATMRTQYAMAMVAAEQKAKEEA
jgi:hypothetical protein